MTPTVVEEVEGAAEAADAGGCASDRYLTSALERISTGCLARAIGAGLLEALLSTEQARLFGCAPRTKSSLWLRVCIAGTSLHFLHGASSNSATDSFLSLGLFSSRRGVFLSG